MVIRPRSLVSLAQPARLALSSLVLGCSLASCGPAVVEAPSNNQGSGGEAQSDAAPMAATVLDVSQGAEITAVLGPDAARDDAGRFLHRYSVALEAGRRVRFHVPSSAELDPTLLLEGPGELAISNDDALPHTLDALLEFAPTVSGVYTLTVSTAPVGQSGRYVLRVTPREPSGDDLVPGRAVQSQLGAVSDAAFPGRSLLRFEAQGGSIVRVRVTSTDFDTMASILGPGGETWFNDDANDLGADGSERALDSTIELSVPVTGSYQVIVSSYRDGVSGTFRAVTSVRPPVTYSAGETVPRGGFAGLHGQGRILGLYGGITAYEHNAQLYGCADDATLLGEAMRASHLQRVDEQIVLTDTRMTRSAFLDGIRALARRAQPEDVVVVFFSGHGGVQAVPAGDHSELDGLDETVVLFDGSLTDTEVARELAEVHAGTVILALDSCHSGGFADDWVSAPGRVGLFSSDSDVLSDVAMPRRAGGYLSYYLRRGVLGDADAKPHDGVLHAGELTDFLLEGMVRDHRLMNADGSVEPAQRFVMQRGSLVWDDVLWVYPRGADLALPMTPALSLESPAP